MEDRLMSRRAFTPAIGTGTTTAWNNSATADTARQIPENCEEVVLSNTSLTARVHFLVTWYTGTTVPTGDAPTLTTGIMVLPNSQIEIGVGPGKKVVRAIASVADGVYGVVPGNRA
jgi:hypothetical protein